MAYCVIANVEALNASRGAYSSTTKPTNTQVETFMTLVAGEIDTILAGKELTVPVTSPAELVVFLQYMNAVGAAALAEAAMLPAGSKTNPHMDYLASLYESMKEKLEEDESVTSGASDSGTALQPWSYLGDLMDTDEEDTPLFPKDKVF